MHCLKHSKSRFQQTVVAISITSVVTIGCDINDSEKHKDTIEKPLEKIDTALTVDKKLTKIYVEKYIAIQQSIKKMVANKTVINTPENSMSLSRFQDIELHAIKTNGLNEANFEIIKNLIIDAQTHIKLRDYMKLNKDIISLLEQTLQRHDETRKRVKNKDELTLLDQHVLEIKEHIDSLKKTMHRYSKKSETTDFNIKIVEQYTNQLNALVNTKKTQ